MKNQDVNPEVSLIVSSYNHPNALDLVLRGIRAQSTLDFELLIADDGSDRDTFDLLEDFRRSWPSLKIATQDDKGFRKARALNRAVLRSRGDLLIFLDGDCIPFPDFVERHVRAHRPMSYSCGGYFLTTPDQAQSVSTEDVVSPESCRNKILGGGYRMQATRLRGVHFRNLLYRAMRKPRKPKILGGNFSVGRDALFAVNGFDERFDGASGEDSDIRNRLNNLGARGRSLWNRAFVLHLHHSTDSRRTRPEVVRSSRYVSVLLENRTRVRARPGLAEARAE